MSDRRSEIANGLAKTRDRISTACREAGRDPAEVTLVVVTKTFPASDVRHLHALGVRDVGENRHPEAGEKSAACADLDLRWHFVGQLQTNKAKVVAGYADVVHSLDRTRLVEALARGRRKPGPLDCLVQVNLDEAGASASGGGASRAGTSRVGTSRGGTPADEVAALAAAVAEHEVLRLRGVMAVAPLDGDADEAFARLKAISLDVRARWPQATWISAGMSGDLEAAVRHGATHVRVGSAILGTRPPAR